MDIPRLETDRLILRAFEERDLDAFAAMTADEEAMRFLGSGPITRAAAWRQMSLFLGHWLLRGFGTWALEEKATGRLLGRAGLWMPEGWPGLELGWMLGREHWGRGFATEAGRAGLDYAWRVLRAPQVIGLIQLGNVRSIRAVERIGETFSHMTFVNGFEVGLWKIDRP